MQIPINKEIRHYQEEIFLGLNLRQMICSGAAIAVAVAVYLGLTPLLGHETAGWVCIVAAAPIAAAGFFTYDCNGVQREHNKKLNNGLPILHKVPPKRDYGRYFCIMAEKGGTSHGGLTEKLSPFFHAKKQEVNAYGR